jgi:N-carbamoyl-L-amino-acid hydrolase
VTVGPSTRCGRRPGTRGALDTVRLEPAAYAAFVELHIEQGPLLERAGDDIGIVTAIAAPASFRIFIEGQGGHAGAVLMPDRHDAFMAAAEMALTFDTAARTIGSIGHGRTVGVCELFPGAINSIPSRSVSRSTSATSTRTSQCGDQPRRTSGRLVPSGAVLPSASEVINMDPPATCAAMIVTRSRPPARPRLKAQRMISRRTTTRCSWRVSRRPA